VKVAIMTVEITSDIMTTFTLSVECIVKTLSQTVDSSPDSMTVFTHTVPVTFCGRYTGRILNPVRPKVSLICRIPPSVTAKHRV